MHTMGGLSVLLWEAYLNYFGNLISITMGTLSVLLWSLICITMGPYLYYYGNLICITRAKLNITAFELHDKNCVQCSSSLSYSGSLSMN